MNVFWRLGYEHTSLDVLMREMRIARQSLYDTFGDKRALYLKALRQYRDNDHLRLRRLFASAQSVKDGFATILFGISSESREEHERAAYYSARIWNAMRKTKSSQSFCSTTN